MARMAKPVCGACHEMIDPIGFGFENFDADRQVAHQDQGKPVDATGELIGSDVDGTFNGVPALAKKLAGSKTVSDCVATQWFRFAAGRAETEPRRVQREHHAGGLQQVGRRPARAVRRLHPDRCFPVPQQRRRTMKSPSGDVHRRAEHAGPHQPPGPAARRRWGGHRPALPGRHDAPAGRSPRARRASPSAPVHLPHRERRGPLGLVPDRRREGLQAGADPGVAASRPGEPDHPRRPGQQGQRRHLPRRRPLRAA